MLIDSFDKIDVTNASQVRTATQGRNFALAPTMQLLGTSASTARVWDAYWADAHACGHLITHSWQSAKRPSDDSAALHSPTACLPPLLPPILPLFSPNPGPCQSSLPSPPPPMQMTRLHRYMSHNMAAVDFYLAQCVLPQETQQFPHRLACTSWHLAENAKGEVVGFSGTKDGHHLLPGQVTQSDPQEAAVAGAAGAAVAAAAAACGTRDASTAFAVKHASQVAAGAAGLLAATDGKMLELLLRTPPYISLQPPVRA